MPRDPRVLVFVGIKSAVIALDERTGAEVWRTKLREWTDYVSVLWDGESLYAANSGEVWRIDPETGDLLWHNELKGRGRGLVSLATSRRPNTTAHADLAAEKRRRDAQALGAHTAAG